MTEVVIGNLVFYNLMSQNRSYCGAWFGHEKCPPLLVDGIRCCCFSPERTKSGNFHWQYYVQFMKPKRVSEASAFLTKHWGTGRQFKCVGEEPIGEQFIEAMSESTPYMAMMRTCKVSVQLARGTPEENMIYCGAGRYEDKNGKVKEANPGYVFLGELAEPGRRTDLEAIAQEVADGVSVDEIAARDPLAYHQYGRTLHKLEELRLAKTWRKSQTVCTWVWGATGVGKSHEAFKDFSPATHYLWPDDNGWCDGYTGQKVVILNDYRGFLKFSFLLQLGDKWPVMISRRNRAPVPFVSEVLWVTSSKHPKDVYRGMDESMDQLYRRFNIIEKKKVPNCIPE